MKITYTAPNRSHHYPYVEAMHRAGHLHAFISGFSRFSTRASIKTIGRKLKRHDFLKNLHSASLKFNVPYYISSKLDRLSAASLDRASFKWAKESDVFIFYRTDGFNTTMKLHNQGSRTLCVMEEVNSHVEVADTILRREFSKLNLGVKFYRDSDFDLRLRTYENADYILCPSEFVRKSFLLKGFTEDKIIKVNFGFPPVEPNNLGMREIDRNVFRLLFVGQLNYRKGIRYAIEAFRKLKHPKKEFVIVGPKTSVTGLEGISIPDGVVFKGILKGELLKEQYRRASVFILPSLEEGLALVQGEALSMGIPLLITTNTGGEDIISDGEEGFIVPPGDTEQLSSRLQQMADDKVLLSNMSLKSFKTALKIGSWDNATDKLVSQLEAKLGIRGNARSKF